MPSTPVLVRGAVPDQTDATADRRSRVRSAEHAIAWARRRRRVGPASAGGVRYFGFERLCKLIAVRLSNPRVTQSREEPSRFFAARGLGAVDTHGRSAPGFLGFGHGYDPGICAYKERR
jgi:hypothetical protein